MIGQGVWIPWGSNIALSDWQSQSPLTQGWRYSRAARDLSAAFDTIDHQILLSRLNNSFGISDTTLSWLQSYLTNRTSSVRIGRHCSSSVTCTTGVPVGSVLGPLLFTAYISPIAGIAHLHNIDQQQYAAATQLFISLSPSDYMPDLDNPVSYTHLTLPTTPYV